MMHGQTQIKFTRYVFSLYVTYVRLTVLQKRKCIMCCKSNFQVFWDMMLCH